MGKLAVNHNSCSYVESVTATCFGSYKEPSLGWQATKENLSCRTPYIILHGVCRQLRSQLKQS